jgi:uncharacterized protein YajQ (UPF0234 family)
MLIKSCHRSESILVAEIIRVQGTKKDYLHIVIQKVRRDSVSPRRVKEADLDFPVQFVNYQ